MPLWMLFVGCIDQVVERGTVLVCLEGPEGEIIDGELSLRGTVGAAAPGSACDSTRTYTVEDKLKGTYTFGFEVRDDSHSDMTPQLEVGEGDDVSLLYRNRLVWGDVAGFVLEDFEGGLIAAGDEGGWGGALDLGDVDGLSVDRGDEVVSREEGECQPIEGYEIEFSADDDAVLTPIDVEEISIVGRPFTAMAVAAWDYGEDADCQITDVTGFTAWAVFR